MRGEIVMDDVIPWGRIPGWLAFGNEPSVVTTCTPAGTEPINAILELADGVSRWPLGAGVRVLVYSTTMPGPDLVDRMEELRLHGSTARCGGISPPRGAAESVTTAASAEARDKLPDLAEPEAEPLRLPHEREERQDIAPVDPVAAVRRGAGRIPVAP